MQTFSRLIALTLAFTLLACSSTSAERARCERCGMYTDMAPNWRAGATTRAGKPVEFDGPKCLVEWLRTNARETSGEPWVTEYYSQTRRPAAESFFVVGSDVRGPMGAEFVPLASRADAQRFLAEHHGAEVLTWSEAKARRL